MYCTNMIIGVSDCGNSSQLFSPTLDCCDHEAYRCRAILEHGIVKYNTMSVRSGYCLTIDEKTDTLETGQCLQHIIMMACTMTFPGKRLS